MSGGSVLDARLMVKFVLAIIMMLAVTPGIASAQDADLVDDACIGIVHFPEEPVANAPSKVIFGLAFAPELAGTPIEIFISGASGDQSANGIIGDDGRVFLEAPLFQYGPHQITEINLTTAEGVVELEGVPIGDDGEFIVDDDEPICNPTTLTATAPAPTAPTSTTTSTSTTTTTTTTTTTEAPTTTTEPDGGEEEPTTTIVTVTTLPEDAADGGSSLPWPGILIGLGSAALLGGAYMALTGNDKNCDQERENLAAAQQRLSMINETSEGALADLAEHEAAIPDLEAKLEAYNKAKRGGSTVDNNVRYYAYGGGRITEQEVDTQIEYYEGLLRIEREARDFDEGRVREWHEKFLEAEQEVRAAEAALYECLGEGEVSAPTPAPQPTAPGTAGPGGPTISTTPPPEETPRRECEDGAVYTETGDPETMRQVVDFAIIVQVMEGTERKVGEANLLAVGLAEAAANLDVIGKAFGAAGAGKSVASGVGNIGSGSYVMGAGGLARGTAEGAMAADLTSIDIPTSPPEAVTELLEGVANLGSFVSGKVGEWLTMNQVYEVRLTQFFQTVTATPYKVWNCVDGKWQCQKLWQYEIGNLDKDRGTNPKSFRLESDVARHQMQSEINTLGHRAQSSIAHSLQARAEFDAKHQPGSCE